MKITIIIDDEEKIAGKKFNFPHYRLDFNILKKDIPSIISEFGGLHNKYK